MHSPWRAVAAFALAPWLVLSPLFPPEHVHERDHDHAQATSHRHAAFHPHDRNADSVSDDDSRVVWTADTLIAPAVVALPGLQPGPAAGGGAVPPPTRWAAITACDTAPPHGPPRACLALRGPPLVALQV